MTPWAVSVKIRPTHPGLGEAYGTALVSHHCRSRFPRPALLLDEAEVAGLASRSCVNPSRQRYVVAILGTCMVG